MNDFFSGIFNYLCANAWTVISGVLGILGFIISLINLIHYFVSRRINLEIVVKGTKIYNYFNCQNRVIVHYQANNMSHLPITITDFRLVLRDEIYAEDFNTHEIASYHKHSKDINDYKAIYNEHLPVNLPMLSSHAGYLVFVIPQDTIKDAGEDLTFRIRTNRHKEVQKTFVLNELVSIRNTLRLKCSRNRAEKGKGDRTEKDI